MNRQRLNLVLAGLLVVLAVAVYFSERPDEPGPPLTALKPEEVTRIAIEHRDAAPIRLEKKGEEWVMTAPVSARAETVEVSSVIGLADKETKETLDPGGLDLAALQLEPPEYTITLNDTAIAFGRVEPLQYRRYVKVGDKVQLIEDPPSAALDEDYADLVSKRLFPDDAQVRRIEAPGLTLSRADGRWTAKPESPKATADAMQKIADRWKDAQSMWNERVPADAKVKGDTATITLKKGDPVTFVIVEREPQFKLLRQDLGIRYVLSKALADELLTLPEPEKEAESKE